MIKNRSSLGQALLALASIFVLTGIVVGVSALAITGSEQNLVTICHTMGSRLDSYLKITVESSLENEHFDAQGNSMSGHEDDLLFTGDVPCPPLLASPSPTPTLSPLTNSKLNPISPAPLTSPNPSPSPDIQGASNLNPSPLVSVSGDVAGVSVKCKSSTKQSGQVNTDISVKASTGGNSTGENEAEGSNKEGDVSVNLSVVNKVEGEVLPEPDCEVIIDE